MENALSTSEGSLEDLLNSEYYLKKILWHLVDDGLYECRLVCRKWFDVCSRLPVKLADVPVTKLPVLVDRFPNAVALSLSPVKSCNEMAGALQYLTQLRNLESINLSKSFYYMMLGENLPFFNLMGEVLRSCHKLHSIRFGDLGDYFVEAEVGMCLYSHLSHLTGLTCLHLFGGWGQFVGDPQTDFRNIEDLKIQSVCLESGQLVFPSLTHLTRLDMRLDVHPAKKFRGEALQMILPYSQSLQSLEICGSHMAPDYIDWELLREFGQLSSVKFNDLVLDEDFCAALNCLNLTHLRFDGCRFSANFIEQMVGVKSLNSLRSLFIDSFSDDFYRIFAAMPQLTTLHVRVAVGIVEPLTVLTALRDLQVLLERRALSDLPQVFSHMPNLESLEIMLLADCGWLSSTCFSHLKNLRSLSLVRYILGKGIFPTLARLSGLTRFRFDVSTSHLQSELWAGINALTNLERLELCDKELPVDQMSLSALMEGKLSKLTYLSFYTLEGDGKNLWRALNRRLPCLRQCFIRDLEDEFVYPEEFET